MKNSNSSCMPKLKGKNNSSNNNKCMSPIVLLERLREAIFRFIMFSSGFSSSSSSSNKVSSSTHQSNSPAGGSSSSNAPPRQQQYYYPQVNQQHHTEAVADCIEFIKTHHHQYSTGTTSSIGSSSRDYNNVVNHQEVGYQGWHGMEYQ